MTDFAHPTDPGIRLSHADRDEAIAQLQAHGADGRLTTDEVEQRSEVTRTAVTRGDLAAVFADLPSSATAAHDSSGSPYASTQPGQPQPGYGQPGSGQPGYGPGSAQYGYGAPGYGPGYQNGYGGQGWGPYGPFSNNPWVAALRYVSPLIAVILFFITGWTWGWQYSWLWFVLVPITWSIAQAFGGGGRGRPRNRDGRGRF